LVEDKGAVDHFVLESAAGKLPKNAFPTEDLMSFFFLVSAALLSIVSAACAGDNCLPSGIKPADVVSAQAAKPGSESSEVKTITVAQKLKELRARCRKGKLVDAKGREICFYQLVGCWGNPPEDYQEILERQAKELASLRKRYNVIEMTCNPSGQQISRSIVQI
jgi:hypothetical protein